MVVFNAQSRPSRRAGIASGLLVSLLCGLTSFSHAKAADDGLVFHVPKLDYAAICKEKQKPQPPLDRDWTTWDGQKFGISFQDAITIAMEYNDGSDRVLRSNATAMTILKYLSAKFPDKASKLDIPYARALIASGGGLDVMKEAEQRLLASLNGGNLRAAYHLGQLYGSKGPASMRDLKAAQFYLQKAAAAGNGDALISYAHLVSGDPSVSEDTKKFTVSNAIIGLIETIQKGDCSPMTQIGYLYLNGDLVPQNTNVAIEWLEAFASNGDAKTANVLAGLFKSNLVDEYDVQKSLTYMKKAADAGLGAAAFNLGKNYATGIGADKNIDEAVKYLKIAAAKSVKGANYWLARYYSGEFDQKVDAQKAKTYYDAALAENANDQDVSVSYGTLLAKVGSVADQGKAIEMLVKAADAGSVDAASNVADIFFKLGRQDPVNFTKASKYYNYAARYGNASAALSLSNMYACGAGLPLSISDANVWREKSAVFGSKYGLYNVGLRYLGSTDPKLAEKGRTYLRQAALKGNEQAIGYVVSRWERGVDGFEKNPEAVARMLKYVEQLTDKDFQNTVNVEIIHSRYQVAATEAEVQAQIAALDPYIANGVRYAMLTKGLMLGEAGNGTEAEQRDLFKRAADAGDPRAMREYGRLLLKDPKVDVSIGRGWLAKAASQGDVKGQLLSIDLAAGDAMTKLEAVGASGQICTIDQMVSIARLYNSVSDPTANEQAKYWMDLARNIVGGDQNDSFTIGSAYFDGIAGPENRYQAEDMFKSAVALGRKSAMRLLAEGHLQKVWKNSDPLLAKQYLQQLYEIGDIEAGNKLLESVADGVVPATFEETVTLVSELQGHIQDPAKYLLRLVRLDEAGKLGGNRDKAVIVDWLKQSADAGEPFAMYRVYLAYLNGEGAERDTEQAFKWLQKSAEAKNAKAAKQLSVAYEQGFGVAADPEKAAYWQAQFDALSKSDPTATKTNAN